MFEGDSTIDLTYSFHYSKLSCWQPFYTAHVIFAYLIFLTGIACMVTRLWTRTHFLHLWLGRCYIMFMLWGTATSLLIHNTGLPIGVLYSFLWTLLGLCTGWVAITIHQKIRFKKSDKLQSKTQNIISRMISLKGFHGCIMFVSWINIAGRVFVTPVSKDFSCFTYPAYKPVTSSHYNYTVGSPITFVEAADPQYNRLPWANKEGAWAAIMLFAPYLGAFLFGVIYLFSTLKDSPVIPDADLESNHAPMKDEVTDAPKDEEIVDAKNETKKSRKSSVKKNAKPYE